MMKSNKLPYLFIGFALGMYLFSILDAFGWAVFRGEVSLISSEALTLLVRALFIAGFVTGIQYFRIWRKRKKA